MPTHLRSTRPADSYFADALVRVRRAVGVTVRQLGEQTGLMASAITKIEKETRTVTVGEAVEIADALGVPLAQMLSGERFTIEI